VTRRPFALPVLAVAGASLALSSCMPAQFSGYYPVGKGTIESSRCIAGIRDTLRVSGPSGTEIMLHARKTHSSGAGELQVYVTIPDHVSMQLLSRDFILESPAWAEPMILPVVVITAPGPREYDPLAVLSGSTDDSRNIYSLWFRPVGEDLPVQAGIPAGSEFSLRLPAIAINGERFAVERILFKPYREWGLYYCIQ
jgi:hypothetical protein